MKIFLPVKVEVLTFEDFACVSYVSIQIYFSPQHRPTSPSADI